MCYYCIGQINPSVFISHSGMMTWSLLIPCCWKCWKDLCENLDNNCYKRRKPCKNQNINDSKVISVIEVFGIFVISVRKNWLLYVTNCLNAVVAIQKGFYNQDLRVVIGSDITWSVSYEFIHILNMKQRFCLGFTEYILQVYRGRFGRKHRFHSVTVSQIY